MVFIDLLLGFFSFFSKSARPTTRRSRRPRSRPRPRPRTRSPGPLPSWPRQGPTLPPPTLHPPSSTPRPLPWAEAGMPARRGEGGPPRIPRPEVGVLHLLLGVLQLLLGVSVLNSIPWCVLKALLGLLNNLNHSWGPPLWFKLIK